MGNFIFLCLSRDPASVRVEIVFIASQYDARCGRSKCRVRNLSIGHNLSGIFVCETAKDYLIIESPVENYGQLMSKIEFRYLTMYANNSMDMSIH